MLPAAAATNSAGGGAALESAFAAAGSSGGRERAEKEEAFADDNVVEEAAGQLRSGRGRTRFVNAANSSAAASRSSSPGRTILCGCRGAAREDKDDDDEEEEEAMEADSFNRNGRSRCSRADCEVEGNPPPWKPPKLLPLLLLLTPNKPGGKLCLAYTRRFVAFCTQNATRNEEYRMNI